MFASKTKVPETFGFPGLLRSGDSVLVQDIGDTSLKTSETPGLRLMLEDVVVEGPPVITALFVEHQSPSEVAARYGVHRSWVYKLKPATSKKATPRSNPSPGAPRHHRPLSHQRPSS